ncbi:MAG: hypothetical protein J7497_12200 [Chitinophagaceae bacterium]|nr:hypothetical protein [Chitinophagaceae bacterium]
MNNLSPLGMVSGIVLSVFLNGTSFNFNEPEPYVINNSNTTIYYKPESTKANPGLDQDAAYPIAPGEALYQPVDAIVTSATETGKVYRIPTGGRVVVNQSGEPEPSGFIARTALLLPAYGITNPPCDGFAMLANSKHTLLLMPDLVAKLN